MRAIAAILLLAALAGCDSVDRSNLTTFDPAPGGTFVYKAKASSMFGYAENSPSDEQTRLRWLAKYLSDNNLCTAGYKVDSRSVVVTGGPSLLGSTDQEITYRGHCT